MKGEDLRIRNLEELLRGDNISDEYKKIILQGVNAYKELCNFDSLTGVYNRRYFDETLQKEIARSNRHNIPLSLIMLDVDNFKKYNDVYGHLEGDNVLNRIGNVLNGLREEDVPCRYGGEEFVVLLPELLKEDAVKTAERIRKEINQLVFTPKDKPVNVSASLGVAEYFHNEPQEIFVKRADENLYTAKENGRNRVFYGNKKFSKKQNMKYSFGVSL